MLIKKLDAPNIELLDKVIDWIETHPQCHDQGDWYYKVPKDIWEEVDEVHIPGDGNVCGTRACVAGWAVILGGFDMIGSNIKTRDGKHLYSSSYVNRVIGTRDEISDDWFPIPAGVSLVAARLLGLDVDGPYDYACALFDGGNDMASIKYVVDAIKNRTDPHAYGDDYDYDDNDDHG